MQQPRAGTENGGAPGSLLPQTEPVQQSSSQMMYVRFTCCNSLQECSLAQPTIASGRTGTMQKVSAFTYSSPLMRQSTNLIAQSPWDQQLTQEMERLSLNFLGEKSFRQPLALCACWTGWCWSGCWHRCSIWRDAICRGWGSPHLLQNVLVYIFWP